VEGHGPAHQSEENYIKLNSFFGEDEGHKKTDWSTVLSTSTCHDYFIRYILFGEKIFSSSRSKKSKDLIYGASTKYAVLGRCAPEGFFWPAIIGEKSSRNGESKPRAVRTRPRSKRESGTVGSAHHVAAPHEHMQEPSPAFRTPFWDDLTIRAFALLQISTTYICLGI
jgi:hypothetical protein